jgi:hypothetical protein
MNIQAQEGAEVKGCVDRMLDLRYRSRLDQLEAAFRALGKDLSVQIRDAA